MEHKSLFTSKRERNLWIWSFIVVIAIYSTLFFGGRLIDWMVRQRLIEQTMFNLFLLLILAFFLSGWKSKTRKSKYWIYAGVIAVIGMTLLRLDLTVAERSHMFEYGLLSILIYEALGERKSNGVKIRFTALFAVIIGGTIGLVDELIQLFIPFRVFDLVDIGFNYLASFLGVSISLGVAWLQRFTKKARAN